MTIFVKRGNPPGSAGDDLFYATVNDWIGSPVISGGAGADTMVLFGGLFELGLGILQANALANATSIEVFVLSPNVQFTLLDNLSDRGIIVSNSHNNHRAVVDGHFLQTNALLYNAGTG